MKVVAAISLVVILASLAIKDSQRQRNCPYGLSSGDFVVKKATA